VDDFGLQDSAKEFDNVLDCGLFHVLSNEDPRRYIGALGHVLKSGGDCFCRALARGARHDWATAGFEGRTVESLPVLFDGSGNLIGTMATV
jgi:cyclopropane fatty-acyl-phospholipid synthase-like methyltransferase